jgi:hypothetical protein
MSIYDDLAAGEPALPLNDVPAQSYVPRRKGKKICLSTVFRHHQIGINGIRLEAVKCGGVLCTTRAAVLRFYRALTDGDAPPLLRTPARRSRDIERAQRELEVVGI